MKTAYEMVSNQFLWSALSESRTLLTYAGEPAECNYSKISADRPFLLPPHILIIIINLEQIIPIITTCRTDVPVAQVSRR